MGGAGLLLLSNTDARFGAGMSRVFPLKYLLRDESRDKRRTKEKAGAGGRGQSSRRGYTGGVE